MGCVRRKGKHDETKGFCLSVWEAAIALTVNVEEILGEEDFAGEIRSLVSRIKFDVTVRPAVG